MQGRALPQALLINVAIKARAEQTRLFCRAVATKKKRSALKGGFGWIVDMTEDISPPPATKNRRNIAVSPVVVGHHIEISNRFIDDFERVILFMKWLDDRRL